MIMISFTPSSNTLTTRLRITDSKGSESQLPAFFITFASPRIIPIAGSKKSTNRVSIQVKMAKSDIINNNRRAIGPDQIRDMDNLKSQRDEIIADKQGFADSKTKELEQQISVLPVRRAQSGNISMRTHLTQLKSSIEKDPITYADNQLMLIEAAIAEAEAVTDGN